MSIPSNSDGKSHARIMRRYIPRSKKPLGLPTRGKTAPNRLRPTDTYLALCHAGFLRALPGLYVDLGFGETPQTTLESAARLRRVNPDLQLLGVEIDPARVAAARESIGPGSISAGRIQSASARRGTRGNHPRHERPAAVSGGRLFPFDRSTGALFMRGRTSPGGNERSAGPADGLPPVPARGDGNAP